MPGCRGLRIGAFAATRTRHNRREEKMELLRVYRLNKGVQVRREKFGLLFYNYRGPRLYFLPSQDFVKADFFDGTQSLSELVSAVQARHNWPRSWIAERLGAIMGQLEDKGLIHGQSIC